ncbi:MAG: hypothetical protein IJT65_00965 [Eubacterium sp.]|nr:hypothetical protein [Eubacterium sp.]
MNYYLLRRIGYSALSLLLALSIVGFVAGVSVVVFFQDSEFVVRRVEENKKELIEVIDDNLSESASKLGLPSSAFTGAVNDDNISIISHEIAKNIMYCYTSDFSDNKDLFNAVSRKYSEYVSENNLTYSSTKIDMDASYATNALSEALYTEDTTRVLPFKVVHQKLAVYIVTGSVIMIVLSSVAIERVHKRRHRKYVYYGMGVVTSGYLMSVVSMFIVASGLVGKYHFTNFTVYQNTITMCIDDALKLIALAGLLFIAAGAVILIWNYKYFKEKNEKAQESIEIKKKLREEFNENLKLNEKEN